MEPLGIEDSRNISSPTSPTRLPRSMQEKKALRYALVSSLGFISTGYHLSVFNSVSVFLWLGCHDETDYYSFKSKSDAFFMLSAFVTAAMISLNKIKFRFDQKFLIAADIIMIIGTLATFAVFSESYDWIMAGRFISGIAAGINITIILSFVREVQFHLSEAKFKQERRRFFIDVFFSLGVFLGFVPAHIFPTVENYPEYLPVMYQPNDFQRPDIITCLLLCFIPAVTSIARTGALLDMGEIVPGDYSQALMDEGLLDSSEPEEEDTGRLYMIKFKESRSLVKLLKNSRVKLGLCCALIFTQMWSGGMIFTVNPLEVAVFFKEFYWVGGSAANVQFTVFEFGLTYLAATVLSSLVLNLKKIPRRSHMYFGCLLGALSMLAIVVLAIRNDIDHIKTLALVYCFGVSVGVGPAVELFYEEVLPAKGAQFLASFKWLVLAVFSIATGYTLRFPHSYLVLCIAMLVVCVMLIYAICDLIPETCNVGQFDINKLFQRGAEKGETETDLTNVSTITTSKDAEI